MNDPTEQHEAMQMCMDCGCPNSEHDLSGCKMCSCERFHAQQPTAVVDNVLPKYQTLADALEAPNSEPLAPVVELKSADPLRKFTAAAEARHGFAPGGLVDAMNRDRTKRGEILAHAAALVDGPRNDDYGDPVENHERIAALWSVVFGHVVTAEQVALCMDLVKTARLIHNPRHSDSWLDKCGYSAIGGAIAHVHETGQNF